MNNKLLLTALVAFIVGAGGGYFIGSDLDKGEMPDESMMHGAMSDMMSSLNGKTGDSFDRAFLAEMVVHHEGAVEMAQAALQNAKHAEIKTMAEAIISAQTTEIQQMQNWQQEWYGIRQ